ncbi:hypothetical protein TNCV_1825791 [Trichonephila clavipes]|nr:hypothetical protein TNCV_1825791 [Trichonephila clavipes]
MQLLVLFCPIPPKCEGEHPGEEPVASHLSSSSTNLTRGLVPRRLFRELPRSQDTIYLQTYMPSPGFKPRSYGTTLASLTLYQI